MTDDAFSFRGTEESGGGHYGWEGVSNLTHISDDKLRARFEEPSEGKRAIIYRRSEGRGCSPGCGGDG